jgi:hypothetical protein
MPSHAAARSGFEWRRLAHVADDVEVAVATVPLPLMLFVVTSAMNSRPACRFSLRPVSRSRESRLWPPALRARSVVDDFELQRAHFLGAGNVNGHLDR